MVRSIAHKEFLSTLRDRRFAVLSLLVLALLLAATLASTLSIGLATVTPGMTGHAALDAAGGALAAARAYGGARIEVC